MKINGLKVKGRAFAYDGCHKIYICESPKDERDAKNNGYNVYPLADIETAFNDSCGLRFISNWKLNKQFVGQFEDATFAS